MAGKWPEVGLNHVGAYEVSGKPWTSGNIDCLEASRPGGYELNFPYVTRWVKVINRDTTNACKVAFSLSGMTGSSNFFTVPEADTADGHGYGDSGILELKVSSLWISGSNTVDVIAGLTSIEHRLTSTAEGKNWSGSSGVG